jgi:uncharacterized protein (TIGR02145 family)
MNKSMFAAVLFLMCLLFSCEKYNLERTNPRDSKGLGYNPSLPTLTTSAAKSVTDSSAIFGGDVTSDGLAEVTARGICWDTLKNPTIVRSNNIASGTGTGNFEITVTKLKAGAKYYYISYATNSVGTGYGKQDSVIIFNLPTLTSISISSITSTTAVSGGNISSDGGSLVTARGVCWNTVSNPTTTDSKTSDGTDKGIFTSNITGLTSGQMYHVRAYATNIYGTSYGADISFTTIALPTITTTPILAITNSSASSGGDISSDGGAAVTVRGVCWSTLANPTITDSKTSEGTGTGSFSSNLSGLSEGTTYHLRAYAANSAGTAYGADISFTTLAVPTITTTPILDITTSTASSGGNITSDGGAAVTVRGICWSTNIDPTIVLSTKTSDGTGTGIFTSSITNLTTNTLYYVRAYATNNVGTAYGQQISFTTQVTDIDGNIYNTVVVGNQIWMAENLKTTKYNDGTNISGITDNSTWGGIHAPAYCWYNNDITYKPRFGAIYNGYVIYNGKNVCPTGWHVPTDGEWTTLTTYLGGESVGGGKLKESGTTLWMSPNNGATNETGFTALPGGERIPDGSFNNFGYGGYWWSSTELDSSTSWYRYMDNRYPTVARYSIHKALGFSIRCLRDN